MATATTTPRRSTSTSSSTTLHIALSIPTPKKYPAKSHARRTATLLPTPGYIFIPSTCSALLDDSDLPAPFRQRRAFLYLTGASSLADSYIVYDTAADTLTLLIPPEDPGRILWEGRPPTPSELLHAHDVDAVARTTQLPSVLRGTGIIYCLPDLLPPETPAERTNTEALNPALDACRVYKDAYEISLLRAANDVTAAAHAAVMKRLAAKPRPETEAELEGVYVGACISRMARNQGYEPIVAAGRNAATLHYTRNSATLKECDLLLLDAGCEVGGYTADVTRTFPMSGVWTEEQKRIYDLVEKMQDECIERTVAGTDFKDIHAHAHKVALEGLLELGILNGEKDEIEKVGTTKAFFPHGLGHMLGLDAHDVGLPTWTAAAEGVHAGRKPRWPRTLEADMVVTIEPGIYFSPFILSTYLNSPVHSQFIDTDVLQKYLPVGGVRIEDDILILPSGQGNENLTTAPKGEEMLRLLRGE